MAKNYGLDGLTLNSDGIKKLLRSSETQTLLDQYAQRITDRANSGQSGYFVSSKTLSTRARSRAVAGSDKAAQDNLDNNTLLKALGEVQE